jgi:hypothetical protein
MLDRGGQVQLFGEHFFHESVATPGCFTISALTAGLVRDLGKFPEYDKHSGGKAILLNFL